MGKHSDETIDLDPHTEAQLLHKIDEALEDIDLTIEGQALKAPKPIRHCAECGTEYKPKAHTQRFCQTDCEKAYNTRERSRAVQLFRAAYHHRLLSKSEAATDRHDAAIYLEAMDRLLDDWFLEDANEGRKPPRLPSEF